MFLFLIIIILFTDYVWKYIWKIFYPVHIICVALLIFLKSVCYTKLHVLLTDGYINNYFDYAFHAMFIIYFDVCRKNIRGRKVMLRSVSGEKMNMHPKSVLMHTECFPSPLVMYHIRQKSTSLYIHDGTVVFPLSLVFFGDQFRYDFLKSIFWHTIEDYLYTMYSSQQDP